LDNPRIFNSDLEYAKPRSLFMKFYGMISHPFRQIGRYEIRLSLFFFIHHPIHAFLEKGKKEKNTEISLVIILAKR